MARLFKVGEHFNAIAFGAHVGVFGKHPLHFIGVLDDLKVSRFDVGA